MSPIDDLALQLAGPDVATAVNAENPYLDIAKSFDSIPNIVAATAAKTPGASLSDALIPTLLSSVTGGLLSGLGEDYSATLTDRYQKAAAAAAAGQAPDPDAYLPPSLLTKASNAASMFKLREALDNAQKDTDAQREVNKTIAVETDPRVAMVKSIQAGITSGAIDPNVGAARIADISKNGIGAITGSAGTDPASQGLSVSDYADAKGVDYKAGMTYKQVDSIASTTQHDSQALPDADRKIYEALGIAKTSAAQVIPILQKIESSQDPDAKNMNLAELVTANILPESDANVLKTYLPVVAQNISNANPIGRVPQKEIDKINTAIGSDTAIAAGVSSQRLIDMINTATGAYKDTLGTLYPGTQYGKAAANVLSSPTLSLLAGPATAPNPADPKYIGNWPAYVADRDAFNAGGQ